MKKNKSGAGVFRSRTERKKNMPKLNENYLNVQDSYLFAEIARRVKVYEENHPDKAGNIIRLGIGDVTRPLTKSAIEGLHKAVDEQAVSKLSKDTDRSRDMLSSGKQWLIIIKETA